MSLSEIPETLVPLSPLRPEALPDGRLFLLVLEGDSSKLYPLPRNGALLIGRTPAADIALKDPSVSRQHARLCLEQGEARLFDLQSHNGARVNGKHLRGGQPLQRGDVVTLGNVTLAFYRVEPPSPQRAGLAAAALLERLAEEHRVPLGERTVLVAEPSMARLFELLRRLASSPIPVLIQGETGVGKEHAAWAVHHWSPRASGPFLALNCAALPESLVESELFGYERGAFSGADKPSPGLLEKAAGGTLFLDEVAELSLPVQAKLLRALDQRLIRRLGDSLERPVDLRVVAATHRELEKEVREGRFRQDLFFRLSAAVVTVPPLRARSCELPLLANAFLEEACSRAGRAPLTLSAAAMGCLNAHSWPGNVRELKHAMEYAAVTSPGPIIEPSHLSPSVHPAGGKEPARTGAGAPDAGLSEEPHRCGFRPLAEELRELERLRMAEALEAAHGVQKRAAQLIGMPLRTFVFKLKQHKRSSTSGSEAPER